MTARAENKLAQCIYTGKKRKRTLEKYATLHKEQNNILKSLIYHGYTIIDQRSKATYLS